MSGLGPRLVLSGTAKVYCVHDREKRVVTTERQVAELGLEIGIIYDQHQHRIHECACCGNKFLEISDEPRFCSICQRPLVHPLGGPLPEPKGVVG
jgi:ribosomal protein S27E